MKKTDLLVNGATESLSIKDDLGQIRNINWTYPSSNQCMTCHTQVSGFVLGPRTNQLNGNFSYSHGVKNQLSFLNQLQYFSTNLNAPSSYAALSNLSDSAATLEKRGKSYLASNCAHCHQPGGPSAASMDFRFETAFSSMNIRNVPPQFDNLGISNPMLFAPGSKERSIIWERMRRLDGHRMPPLGSGVVDSQAIDILGRWITNP